MEYNYIGQEKVRVKSGQFKDVYGYVRRVEKYDYLWLILDNGRKTSIHKDEVEFIYHHYFLEKMEEALLMIRNDKLKLNDNCF